jgi:hypothetical protein
MCTGFSDGPVDTHFPRARFIVGRQHHFARNRCLVGEATSKRPSA